MAFVTAQAIGGKPQLVQDVATVGDIKAKLALTNYAATINGEPAEDGDELEDGQFVTFAPQVKGA